MSIRPIALVVLAVVSANQASAGVIYDNGVTNFSPLLLVASDFALPTQTASDFILSAGASTITEVHWSGAYESVFENGLPTDDFRIRFFADIAGVPDSSPLEDLYVSNVDRTFVGTFFFGDESFRDIYSYQADIAPLTLLPNTPYWLSIVNNLVPPGDNLVPPGNNLVPPGIFFPFWQWAGRGADEGASPARYRTGELRQWGLRPSNGTDTIWRRRFDGDGWDINLVGDVALDFQLTDDNLNAVPEPASIATWALLGLGAIGFRRRRKLVAEADERASR